MADNKMEWWLDELVFLFCYVTAQIYNGTVTHQLSGRHGGVLWQVARWNDGSVDRSPGYVTVQIYGGTVTHQLSGRHGGMMWQVTKWNGGSMSRVPWFCGSTKAQREGVMVSW